MDQTLPPLSDDTAREIAALAQRYRRANGPVISLVTKLGGSFEKQLSLLPAGFRDRVGQATEAALRQAWGLADQGGRRLPDPGRRGAVAAAMVTGAAGGAGGITTSLAELPVTVTLILHAIRAEAVAAGLDPADSRCGGRVPEGLCGGQPPGDR